MTVIDTNHWLQNFIKSCKNNRMKNYYLIQQETLCKPISKYFSKIEPDELQFYLLENGLFEAKEWRHIEEITQEMEKRRLWTLIDQEYKKLKKKWQGPDIPILIFPIKKAHQTNNSKIHNKGGLAFKHAVFLFLSPYLSNEEIKSVFAHEYSHVCRLTHLNMDEVTMPLKELIILEGIGEYVVKELYGEHFLAPWIKLYDSEQMKIAWNRDYINNLNVTNQTEQHLLLYGKGDRRLPKWIGYNMGFYIVESYQKENGPVSSYKLLRKTTDEIIKGSEFAFFNEK